MIVTAVALIFFGGLLGFVVYKTIVPLLKKIRPSSATATSVTPPTTTKTSLPLSAYLWRIGTVAVIGSLLWHETRESFWMGIIPNIAKEYVIGEVLIPYKMRDLREGRTQDCLPQGIWKFMGAQTQTPHYQYTKDGRGYNTGFYNRDDRLSVNQSTISRLPVKDEKRFGNLLISTQVSQDRSAGDVIVVKGECEMLTIDTNLPPEVKGDTLLELGGKGNPILLRFVRE